MHVRAMTVTPRVALADDSVNGLVIASQILTIVASTLTAIAGVDGLQELFSGDK